MCGMFAGEVSDDPMRAALPNKDSFQYIRALPAPAGSAVLFTHRLIHWVSRSVLLLLLGCYPFGKLSPCALLQGSRGEQKSCNQPRICMSFGTSDASFETPYFDHSHLPLPPFGLRLSLVCGQMIVYHERFIPTLKLLQQYHTAFVAHLDDFHPDYVRKVQFEYAQASIKLVESKLTREDPPLAAEGKIDGVQGEANQSSATVNGASPEATVNDEEAEEDALLEDAMEVASCFVECHCCEVAAL
eukprot:scaffold507_cov391-Prasinococcus_capsulatus_cf.AAC.2